MYLTTSELLRAQAAGKAAGETRDGLYDSTPPAAFRAHLQRAQEWRNAYAVAYTNARHKRGI